MFNGSSLQRSCSETNSFAGTTAVFIVFKGAGLQFAAHTMLNVKDLD